jgi:hypothetical protein
MDDGTGTPSHKTLELLLQSEMYEDFQILNTYIVKVK